MKILYNIFFLVFSILYIPYLLLKKKWHKEFMQKFGYLPDRLREIKSPVWIHSVSVGEAVLAAKLAKAIKNSHPGINVVVSTTTSTGNDMIHKVGKGVVDAVFYYPMDISWIVSKVVDIVNPGLYIMIETELWPNLIEELSGRGIPIVLANGRISDKSFSNYMKIRFITKKILRNIDLFCMQTEKDAERIRSLGAGPEKVHLAGNMKFDEGDLPAEIKGYKETLGFPPESDVFVAGSTHFPEETHVIEIFKYLRQRSDDLRLVLAPRHVERVDAIKVYLERSGLRYRILSEENDNPDAGGDVLLVDTIGHLKQLYSIATVIFVGGSIAKKGGQNPMEAAMWGKPVVFGPNMYNFREVADIFVSKDAAVMVGNPEELKETLEGLLKDKGKRERLSRKAVEIIKENSGAIGRTVEQLDKYLKG